MNTSRLTIIGALALLASSPAYGQDDFSRRVGLWGGVGLGGGYGEGAGEYQGGGALNGQLGWMLGQRSALGADLSAWAWRSTGVTVSATNLAAMYTFFTSSTGGFFLKGGLGFGATTQGDQRSSGFGTTLGLGQDVRIGDTLFLTPAFTFMFQRIEDQSLEFFLFTIGLTWR